MFHCSTIRQCTVPPWCFTLPTPLFHRSGMRFSTVPPWLFHCSTIRCYSVRQWDVLLFHHQMFHLFTISCSTVPPWLFHFSTIRCCTDPTSLFHSSTIRYFTVPPWDVLLFHHDWSTVPPFLLHCSTIRSTFKAFHKLAPTYISELVSPKDTGGRYYLRWNNGKLLKIPPCKSLSTLGDRSFYMAAPKL